MVGVRDLYVGYCGVVVGVWDSYVGNCVSGRLVVVALWYRANINFKKILSPVVAWLVFKTPMLVTAA